MDDVLYVGTVGGMEADIVLRAGVRFRAVQAGGLRGLSLGRLAVNAVALLQGCAQAYGVVRDFRPDVTLATGGYASAPAVLAAWLRRCPVLLYLPDILPGLAVRALSHLAKKVAVSFDASVEHFPEGKAVVTGYPVRPGLAAGHARPARRRLGLAPELETVLIMGGSRGSHAINQAVNESLESLLGASQLIHVTGEQDIGWMMQRKRDLDPEMGARYQPHDYLHETMLDALQAADLVVARAGAATMGEFAAVGLPSVLVPLPYAGVNQEANADFMVQKGAACKMAEAQIGGGALACLVKELLGDPERRRVMAENALALARPDAAAAIARQLVELQGGG